MGRRKNDSLSRKSGTRRYRTVCWVSAEGSTERDYFGMDVFREADVSLRFPKDVHPDRRNPAAVLKRFQKALRAEDFRASDEAWIVVDVDEWDREEIDALYAWAEEDDRHHVVVSNPKFELFLLMHFEKASGCTTSAKVDAALKRHMPSYDKRLGKRQFSRAQVSDAITVARMKRAACRDDLPGPGMTDAYLLAERLIGTA